jgi:hypothetical protein
MPTSWQVECLKARLNSLNAEISRVSEKDHPYPEPDVIYAALHAVLRDRADVFNDAITQYVEDADEPALHRTFDTVRIDLERVSEFFGLADRVDSARIPFEILRALSWMAKQLLQQECRAVVRLDGTYNYSIVSCRTRFEELGWADFWEEALRHKAVERTQDRAAPVSDVMVLGFPSPDANCILLHALAAHELGHYACARHVAQLEAIRDEALIHVKREHAITIQEYIAETSKKHLSDHDAYEQSSNFAEARLFTIADRWLSEVAADVAAARLVGPAFLGAFDRIVLDVDKTSDTHPPSSLRRESTAAYLKASFPHIVGDTAWTPLLADPTSSTRSRARGASAILYQIGEKIVRHSLPALSRLVSTLHSPLQDQSVTGLIDEIEKYFMELAPPVAPLCTAKPLSTDGFWILMFAAWRFRLNPTTFDAFKSRYGWSDDATKAEDALGNLLLHSIQSLELRYQWENRPETPMEK